MPSLPLGRFRMLDLSRQLPGPFCSTLLADLGMDVLVVTAPRDPFGLGIPVPGAQQAQHDAQSEDRRGTRRLPAAGRRRRRAARGLPSRRHEAARASTRRLCAERNPRLVYCAISGYGQDGPYRDSVGHDVNYLGYAGVLEYVGAPDGAPMIPRVQIADIGGGLADGGGRHPVRADARAADRPGADGRHLDARRRRRLERLPPADPLVHGPARRSAARSSSPGTGRATTSTRRGTAARSPSARTSRHFWSTLCRHFGRAEFIPRPVLGGAPRRDPRPSSAPLSARRPWPSGSPSWRARHLLRSGAEHRGSVRRSAAAPSRHGGRDGHAERPAALHRRRPSSSRTRRPRCARRRRCWASTRTRCCATSATPRATSRRCARRA